MGWWEDAGDNVTAFFGGTTPEKVRANRARVKAYSDANKPLPSIQRDLGNKTALAVPKANPHNLSQSTLDEIVRKNTLPADWNSRTRQTQDDIPPSVYRDGPAPRQQSPLEILMERLNQGYQGPDPSQMDFSALDKALESRIGLINDARNRMRGNFDQSDAAVAGMHRAFENSVRTEDAARYNQIADQQRDNINATNSQVVGNLEAARAKAVAERQAMLKNLGIEAAGAAVDEGNAAYDRGINTSNENTQANLQMGNQQRANNLSYNNTVAQSIGQAGVQRRAALQQQLQALLGKADMAETEARAQYETEKQRTISSANNAGYDQWNDQQNRNMDLFKILSDQELAREKMNMPEEDTYKPQGMAAIANDLEMSGADPNAAQRGLQALSQILAEGNYLNGANGPEGNTPYDRVNIITQKLREKGVDPFTASQIGISYGNL